MIVTDDGQVLDMPLHCPFAWSGGQSYCSELCALYLEEEQNGKVYVRCMQSLGPILGELVEEQMTHTDFLRRHREKRGL
jgi:hypothetical protein